MSSRSIYLKVLCSVTFVALVSSGVSQTFQVDPQGSTRPEVKAGQKQAPEQPLGWGSNIENARLARAAQLALQRGDHAVAFDYAQRATQSAPNDPQLWFLLGYAARLDGKYAQAVEAYKRGSHISPTSLEGLSGLGQTYSLMGRNDEAERLLKQAIAADPRRRDDLLILGNIYVHSGDYSGALQWLARAESIKPEAQSELLIAISYEHLNQQGEASRYLELAKSRAPNNPDVIRSLAGFFRDTHEYGKAVDELRSIRNPKPDVVAELAYTYGLDGKPADSARLYMQAANALPRDLGLQLSAAQAQVVNNHIELAAPFLQRASLIDANNYRLHAIRGDIARIQERDNDAASEYATAVAHLPASPAEGPLYGIQLHMILQSLYRNLDETELANQQLAIARAQIGSLSEQGTGGTAFLNLRALIKMDAGELDSALRDMQKSLSLNPRDPNSLQLDGDLLMKVGRTADAVSTYLKVLDIEPKNRFALTSLGYAYRATGDNHNAQKYFGTLERDYPTSYVPYLALGDLYTATADYKKAQTSYAAGYALAPQNALIVGGGMNAAIESHDLVLAGSWLHRVTDKMTRVPQVLREEERYYYFEGDMQKSAEIGLQAIKVLPQDREVVVYLGYDLLRLERYAELQALATKYMDSFPKQPDIPLLAGYVYKHDGHLDEAVERFTEALRREPNTVTAYVNRGFVRNDLDQSELAAADFEEALKREPKNSEAHMGLAFAELNLRHFQAAIRQTQLAEEEVGDSELVHTIRATAYGNQGQLTKAATEYQAALKFDPNDGSLHLGLGNIYFSKRRFHEASQELQVAQTLLPEDPMVDALLARTYAGLNDREQAMREVKLAEEHAERKQPATQGKHSKGNTVSDVYLATGEALSTLGDQAAAMERFNKALLASKSNRMSVRLAVGRLMVQQGHFPDAQRQIALAQMEVEVGDTVPPTGDQYIEAANMFQQMHEYELSQSFLERAKAAGAADVGVRIARANNYLALGETRRAAAELAAVKHTDDSESDYEFLLAEAAVHQQEHNSTQALSAFAAAASASGEDQTAEDDLLQAGANEGFRINRTVSALTNFVVQPIFEDSTVYVLDSKLNSPNGPVPITNVAQLPPPRSSIETDWTNAFHLHLGKMPTSGGFFQLRNARGVISVPATNSVVHRNTTDYTANFGVAPTFHVGANVITVDGGVQGTIRRDSLSPIAMNQNRFRLFTYVSTSSFFNAVSVSGYVTRDVGPFTENSIHEQTLAGAINFRVGAPWAKTALVTGWGSNHQRFTSTQIGNSENYYTSSYVGISHRFSTRLSAEVLAEDLRTWRVVPFSPIHSAISQALRPAATVDFSPRKNWDIQASTAYENTRGFHIYDVTQNGVSLSYTRPLGRTFNDLTGDVHLRYPVRVSGGIQEETFLNFTGGKNQQFRPYVSLTIF